MNRMVNEGREIEAGCGETGQRSSSPARGNFRPSPSRCLICRGRSGTSIQSQSLPRELPGLSHCAPVRMETSKHFHSLWV